jgi:subtilisin family serine protease
MLPAALSFVPLQAQAAEVTEEWWHETTVDRNGDGIGDMVVVALNTPGWVDEEGRLSVIVDFDHTPTSEDTLMLATSVGFQQQWELPLIDALAGTIPTDEISTASRLSGVVMIELDGILEIAMDSVVEVHGVDIVWQETGYTGAGSTVAIIDTGIDGAHVGLDDLDDDNSTNDTKVIAFYDAVNAPGSTNGTEVFPYDDQGHGSHCAGITAGTGAPDYDFVGVAPQANLVGVKVLDSGGSGSFATVMAGMQWTVDHRYEFNIRAASMSLGGPGAIEWTSSEEDSVNRMGNEMMRAGVALFIAAGNSAVSAQIGTPGSAEDVITVGALDKDTKIAVYSSQGPTEEGRIKPNIAFVGSSVMSVAYNSGDQYTSMSGTSMATPGAAGLGALMLQANPDLSSFDLRNIMQETSTYRQCHYMGANEPCVEDLIPKNRQNNVYGHGHVNALPSVLESAGQDYDLNTNYSLNVTTPPGDYNRIHLDKGDSVSIELSEGMDSIQWRANHLRDDWSFLHSYEHETTATITHKDIIHNLEHLPGIELIGNQTISIRAIKGTEASTIEVVNIYIMSADFEETSIDDEMGGGTMLAMGLIIGLLMAIAAFGILKYLGSEENELFGQEEVKDSVDN